MKILLLSDNYPPEPNAGASRVYERAVYWADAGHNVTILTSVPNKPEGRVYPGFENRWIQKTVENGITVVRVKTYIAPNKGTINLLRFWDFISYMLTSFFFGLFLPRPDIIVASSPQFFTAVSGWALSICRRRPFVFEVADLWPESIAEVGGFEKNLTYRLFESIELFLYRRAKQIVLLSAGFMDSLVGRGIDPQKINVIRNGVDRGRFQPLKRDSTLSRDLGLENQFVVGYLGTVSISHSVETVVAAARQLRDLPVRILIVGTGPSIPQIEASIAEQDLENVVLAGRRPKEEMVRYWSLLDLALVHLQDLPIFKTPIPSKIFESMGCGKPILIGVPEGEATKIVRDTDSGVVIPPEDADAMAAAIRRLFQDRVELARLAENAKRSAPDFSREHQARLMIEVFERACTG